MSWRKPENQQTDDCSSLPSSEPLATRSHCSSSYTSNRCNELPSQLSGKCPGRRVLPARTSLRRFGRSGRPGGVPLQLWSAPFSGSLRQRVWHALLLKEEDSPGGFPRHGRSPSWCRKCTDPQPRWTPLSTTKGSFQALQHRQETYIQ